MGGLNRRENIVIPEIVKIIGMDNLCMLNTPAPVILSSQDPGIYLQGFPVGPVSNAVCGHCEIILVGPLTMLLQDVKGSHIEALITRII